MVLVTLEPTFEFPGKLVGTSLGPACRISDSVGLGWGWIMCMPPGSQVMITLLVREPHFENQCWVFPVAGPLGGGAFLPRTLRVRDSLLSLLCLPGPVELVHPALTVSQRLALKSSLIS